METKICNKCGKELPRTTEYFYKNKWNKDGFCYQCKICQKAYGQAYKDAHREIKRGKDRAYYHKHKAHRQICREKRRAYDEAHKKEIRIRSKAYRKAHRNQYIIHWRRRRARKLSATIANFDDMAWLASQPRPLRCYLCGKIIRKNQKYHIDHRIPLSKDGPHAPWNLGITHDKCNLKKSAKTPPEYAPDRFHPELTL